MKVNKKRWYEFLIVFLQEIWSYPNIFAESTLILKTKNKELLQYGFV